MNMRASFPKVSGSVSRLLAEATRPLRLLGLSVVMFGLLGSTVALHAQSNSDPTGTWVIEVSFNGANCAMGDTILYSCTYGLMTFHSDHTLAEVDTFASGAKQSWGAGAWTSAGQNADNLYQFNTTFEQLQFAGAGSPSHYDLVWGPVTLSADGKSFTESKGWFASYNFDGSLITIPGYSGYFSAVGKRMPLLTSAP